MEYYVYLTVRFLSGGGKSKSAPSEVQGPRIVKTPAGEPDTPSKVIRHWSVIFPGNPALRNVIVEWKVCTSISYHITLVSRQDDPNLVLTLATRSGKMALSCPLRIMHCLLQEKQVQSHNIINPLWTIQLVWSRWLDIGLLFCVLMNRDGLVKVHKHTEDLGQYLAN